MSELMPKIRFNRITDITAEDLHALGIKGVAMDADNTTVYDNSSELLDGVYDWIQEIRAAGFKVIILSNAFGKRIIEVSQKLGGIPYIRGAFKPKPFGYRLAAKKMGLALNECAMVGDQLLTDVRGGNRVGMATIHVNPAQPEKRAVKFFERRRAIEKPILDLYDLQHKEKQEVV